LVADVATPTEGGVASFVLSASTAAASAVVDYSILGIQANDTTINLTGTISVGSDGKARLSVPLVIDGQTENESITVTALGFSVTVPITDVSQSNTSPQIVIPVCFALGTLIQTASGPAPV